MADKYQLKAILSAVDKMSPTLKAIRQVAGGTRKSLLDIGKASGRLAGSIGLPFGVLAGVTAGGALMGMKRAVDNYSEYATQVLNTSLKMRQSTDDVQRLTFASEQLNVPVETLIGSTAKLNKNIGDAATGKNVDLLSLFRRLNIGLRDSHGHMRNAIDLLPQLSSAFQQNTNAVVQSRMGNALFGKEWQDLLPLLMAGPDAIKQNMAAFDRISAHLSEQDLQAANDFGDSMDALKMSVEQTGYSILNKLLPTLQPLVNGAIDWVAANRQMITTNASRAIHEFVEAVRGFDWSGFLGGIRSIVRGLGWIVDMVGGARNAMILFALAMSANTIMATFGLIGALTRLVYWLGASAIGLDVVKGKVVLTGGWIAATNSMLGASFGWLKVQAAAAYLLIAAEGPLGAARVMLGALASMVGTTVAGAFGFLRTVILLTGRALFMTPLGIVFSLASAALLIYENWDTLKKWFGGFFDWIGEKWKQFLGWVDDVAKSVGQFFGAGDGSVMNPPAAATPAGRSGAPWAPVAAGQQRVGGTLKMEFVDAPPGMRVRQIDTRGPLDLDLNVGYRSAALGIPS